MAGKLIRTAVNNDMRVCKPLEIAGKRFCAKDQNIGRVSTSLPTSPLPSRKGGRPRNRSVEGGVGALAQELDLVVGRQGATDREQGDKYQDDNHHR